MVRVHMIWICLTDEQLGILNAIRMNSRYSYYFSNFYDHHMGGRDGWMEVSMQSKTFKTANEWWFRLMTIYEENCGICSDSFTYVHTRTYVSNRDCFSVRPASETKNHNYSSQPRPRLIPCHANHRIQPSIHPSVPDEKDLSLIHEDKSRKNK